MRISAREACVRPHFHTRSEIKYYISRKIKSKIFREKYIIYFAWVFFTCIEYDPIATARYDPMITAVWQKFGTEYISSVTGLVVCQNLQEN